MPFPVPPFPPTKNRIVDGLDIASFLDRWRMPHVLCSASDRVGAMSTDLATIDGRKHAGRRQYFLESIRITDHPGWRSCPWCVQPTLTVNERLHGFVLAGIWYRQREVKDLCEMLENNMILAACSKPGRDSMRYFRTTRRLLPLGSKTTIKVLPAVLATPDAVRHRPSTRRFSILLNC